MMTQATSHSRLTAREAQAADLLLEGLKNRAIGQRMGITEGTVKGIMHKVFRKKQVNTRAEFAAKFAARAAKNRRHLADDSFAGSHAIADSHATLVMDDAVSP